MSPLLDHFASPAWSRLVETLLHSLWQGAVIAVGLFLVLRFVSHPAARYRLALLALAGTVAASLVTWAVLQQTHPAPPAGQPAPMVQPTGLASGTPTTITTAANVPAVASVATLGTPPRTSPAPEPRVRWPAWLAVLWLLGAAGMLLRAGRQLAGAGRVRRSGRTVTEGPVWEMLDQVQKALGMARRIRVVVSDQLTSPAVTGVLVPVLILPLSLLTVLSSEQLRFILLHELAHIRRGDYLVNLLQLMVEALWFFNPAVWWLSRQIRLEREACCDAVAITLSGAPVEYARTLLHVAERYAAPGTPALAFGDRREPSGLAERIQRLLSPGEHPRLRLSWGTMLGSLLTGGTLLVLSALGTRLTVAAILTPEQRMDRIEQMLTVHGEDDFTPMAEAGTTAKIAFSGRLSTADGVPLPRRFWIHSLVQTSRISSVGTVFYTAPDGTFHDTCPPGRLLLAVEIPGYAPCLLGPLVMKGTHAVTGIAMVLSRGFDVTIQMVDADSGAPLAGASVLARYNNGNFNLSPRSLTTDASGNAVMTNCANLAMNFIGSAAGYEIAEESFTSLATNQILRLAARRGVTTSGLVLDKTTGQPLAGATLLMLRESGVQDAYHDWDYQPLPLATSDTSGHFATAGLRADTRYRLGVKLPGHESVMFLGVMAGDTNLVARLGPELVVHGRVTGNVQAAVDAYQRPLINYTTHDPEENSSSGWQIIGRLTNGVIYFEFTNRVAGPVDVAVAGVTQTRLVAAPVADWLVELPANAPATNNPPVLRDVVFRLKSADGAAPRGMITVSVPSNPNNPGNYYTDKTVTLTNGEARLPVPVGARVDCRPDKALVGYWFASGFNWTNVPPGEGPFIIDVPVIPAGAIAARAHNADGSPAANLSFSILVLKPSPALANNYFNNYDQGDNYAGDIPRQYVSPPLPLGGKYEILGWRGNAFCSSHAIKLTEESPDPVVDLQFVPGRDLTGRVLTPDGQPVARVTVTATAEVRERGYQLPPVFTDAQGNFRVADCSPSIANYTLNVAQPGFTLKSVKVNFNRLPVTLQLIPGLKLTGRVLDKATGHGLPTAEVRVWTDDGRWPPITVHADADGHYEINTLGDATYQIFVDSANFSPNYDNHFQAGVVTNLALEVKPWPASN